MLAVTIEIYVTSFNSKIISYNMDTMWSIQPSPYASSFCHLFPFRKKKKKEQYLELKRIPGATLAQTPGITSSQSLLAWAAPAGSVVVDGPCEVGRPEVEGSWEQAVSWGPVYFLPATGNIFSCSILAGLSLFPTRLRKFRSTWKQYIKTLLSNYLKFKKENYSTILGLVSILSN